MANWELQLNEEQTFEPDLIDTTVVDTFNPFGNHALAQIEDIGGERFEQYPRGTRVDFWYSTDESQDILVDDGSGGQEINSAYTKRFTGYVVERREADSDGADTLEVEAYSFDQFLRRNVVDEDLSGQPILSALDTIIDKYTPVYRNAGLVGVVDNQTLTQSYEGEKVEDVLRSLSKKSGNEEFGVTEDVEFFWREPETNPAPRDIDNSQWTDYDIPELGAEKINEVEVWFNGGGESVIVDDGSDKTELENSLGLEGPGTQKEEITREDITDISDARAVGEQYLDSRNNTLTGTVTTYGLNDAKPGDVINIQINERGIDGDFRIAEHEIRWGEDKNILTIVEKRGEQDDILVELSNTLDRVEAREANRDRIQNRVTNTEMNAELSISGANLEDSRFVNFGRNAIREGWAGKSNIDIQNIAVGTDGTDLSRTNNDLNNEIARTGVSESLLGSTAVEYSGTFTETGIEEIGLFDGSDNLIVRATIPETDVNSTITLTITVSNDPDVERAVITETGQEAIRDIIADNNPTVPTQYAYGSDDTLPTETDTSLGNQVVSQNLNRVLVSSSDTTPFTELVPEPGPEEPVNLQDGSLSFQPVTIYKEAENILDRVGTEITDAGSYSNDEAIRLSIDNDYVTLNFSFEHRVPANSLSVITYGAFNNFDGSVAAYYDDDLLTTSSYDGITTSVDHELQQVDFNNDPIPAGEEHSYRVEITQSTSGNFEVDALFAVDRRGTFGIDALDGTFDSNTASWNAPEIYPDGYEITFNPISMRRDITEAELFQTWDDTDNNQYIELSNDGGSNWVREDNTDTVNATFGTASRELLTRVNLSRHVINPTITPTAGDDTQEITEYELFANPDAITNADTGAVDIQIIIPQGSIVGTTLREGGQLNSSNELLTRVTFAEFEVQNQMVIISSERVGFNND